MSIALNTSQTNSHHMEKQIAATKAEIKMLTQENASTEKKLYVALGLVTAFGVLKLIGKI
ncbi:hypothetical protein SARC_00291 [Sphaeroforma arctica JP610]|uniref:Uncharacterized protein n=1 Tax=Sphaeroforma arctica JP610 TaxID=667725 RepID=A0A0L0GEZ2_9EUKA|nr:hypothetical protein SARC_00291 [Sphaeroforma arctica JP610]KNC87590.1 hypothetical protein SARC_00291 [Sphaeroforma arctica JP610]|eukprot:XP_014161492.1 hypothetical protein SARC_00291 [Sphaeroforma arctica JP610]